jgi:hypothetical protein
MYFQLPSTLQSQLIQYDPKLKALARQKKANDDKTKSNKSTYPLGKIPHVIPLNVVSAAEQDAAIKHINSQLARFRYTEFKMPVEINLPQAEDSSTHSLIPVNVPLAQADTKAILYHYEQCWYAAWLAPEGAGYIFGYAYVFKDTQSTANVIDKSIWNQRESYQQVSVGRTKMYVHFQYVTEEYIRAANSSFISPWRAYGMGSYHDKSREISPLANRFADSLKKRIRTWTDDRNMFSRIRCTSVWHAVIPGSTADSFFKISKPFDIDTYFTYCKKFKSKHPDSNNRSFIQVCNLMKILDTPFFRKWIQEQMNSCVEAYEDEDNKLRSNVTRGFEKIQILVDSIYYINEIWPDCPIDYYQKHIDQLLYVIIPTYGKTLRAVRWIRNHMPVASFFSILKKYWETKEEEGGGLVHRYDYCSVLCAYRYRFSDWNDVMIMITRILGASDDAVLDPPRRWRFTEFHDYVQAEAWKVANPNEDLPQDLFPEPIKVSHDNKNWTFLQPKDTHILSKWGQAVRNCVGSSNYADGIKKKQHFIVLCMLDSKPVFTIQLNLENGVMNVKQIKGISNSPLTNEQTQAYADTFRKALTIREEQLKSAA